MSHETLLLIGAVLVLGLIAQWLAWKFNLPSIVLLLATGLLLGPATGLLDPDKLLGDLLFPFVSIAVGIILYEGGLSLRLQELRKAGSAVIRLITIGAAVTLGLTAFAAIYLLHMDPRLALMLGAILTVTGPTVVGPMLNYVRVTPEVNNTLKWEGILIDPLGAVLAVLVYQQFFAPDGGGGVAHSLVGILRVIIHGVFFGGMSALLLLQLTRRGLLPDYLVNPASLAFVVGAFIAADMFQKESGLVATTLMGIILRNQTRVPIKHIIEFKETLRLLLISVLFILLAARIKPEALANIGWEEVLFVVALMIIVRPLAVLVSTLRTKLSFRERLFAAWMAPRGIVAAAVSSIFGLTLVRQGEFQAVQLMPITFLVIVVTVVIYGITVKPVAALLGIEQPQPRGVLIVGAHEAARKIAKKLVSMGAQVLMLDINRDNVRKAHEANLTARQGNVLSESLLESLDLSGIGRVVAMTANDEVNTISATRFGEIVGMREVFQLPPPTPQGINAQKTEPLPRDLRGRFLFDSDLSFAALELELNGRSPLENETIEQEMSVEEYRAEHMERIPLFLLRNSSTVIPISTEDPPTLREDDVLMTLRLRPESSKPKRTKKKRSSGAKR
jgi:NhaP-type Na+/H+ or K+/H+ antiporter